MCLRYHHHLLVLQITDINDNDPVLNDNEDFFAGITVDFGPDWFVLLPVSREKAEAPFKKLLFWTVVLVVPLNKLEWRRGKSAGSPILG